MKTDKESNSLIYLGTIISLAWLLVFFHTQIAWRSSPEFTFAFAVPILAAFLFLKIVQESSANRVSILELLLAFLTAGLGLVILFLGYLIKPEAIYSNGPGFLMAIGASLILVSAVICSLGCKQLLRWIPLLIILWLAVPFPLGISMTFTQSLQNFVSNFTSDILVFWGIPSRTEGNIIITHKGTLGIDEACSGLRSLRGASFVAVFFGFFFLATHLYRNLLLIASVLVVVFLNLLRSISMTATVGLKGPNALGVLHDPLGYIVLGLSSVLICLLTVLFLKLEAGRQKSSKKNLPYPKRNTQATKWLTGFISIGFISILAFNLSALSKNKYSEEDFDPPVINPVSDYSITSSNIGILEDQLRFDLAADQTFKKQGEPIIRVYWATWTPGKVAYSNPVAHSPEVCFQLSGWQYAKDYKINPIVLNDNSYPVIWRTFFNDRGSLYVGWLHLVGNEPRIFPNNERGVFNLKSYWWDFSRLPPKQQTVLMFAIEKKGEESALRKKLNSFLSERFSNF